ncbi:MAG TPA: DUF2058 domain-containing protein, partial [Arenimonas sp.]|nr:DUF2058 domain-containing protein [Arenimonas sp.]
MSQTLKDQLLGLGFKDNPKKQNAQQPKVHTAKPTHKKPNAPTQPLSKSNEEIDLAKAFALRQKEEQRTREQAEREKQELARLRKLAKEQVAQLLTGQMLNTQEAEIVRHF